MRKIVEIGNTVFIYLVVLLLLMLFDVKQRFFGRLWGLFDNNGYIPLFYLLMFGAVMYILNVVFFVRNLSCLQSMNQTLVQTLVRNNMKIKLIQMPAYVFIFMIGVICMGTIFTIGISFALMILDMMGVGLTGIYALSGFSALRKRGILTSKEYVGYAIFSFLFCLDIMAAIKGYGKSKQEM